MNIVALSEPMQASGGRIEGGSPLAGHLGLASLLVREAVQNSWDARDDERAGPVHFSIEGWDLDTDALAHLKSLLPVADLRGFERTSKEATRGVLHPVAALDQASVRVLIISDRRTVGLCGPTTSGRQWDPVRHGRPLERGQQRFANFIRNQGRATSDTGGGDGGAYGLGKSALWMASSCGTALIHSRTSDEYGEPTERFIGCVLGEHHYRDGIEYTGRHFIGRLDPEADLIEPLTGAEADAARRGLPIPAYEIDGQQTDGTSVVIVAPRLQLDWATEMDRLRDAVRWHVWPKRVPGIRDPEDGPDMEIRLAWNNHPVEVPEPLKDPEVRPYARALLDCARDRNDPEPGRDHEARCGRPVKELGKLKFRRAGEPDANAFHLTLTESDLEASAERSELSIEAVDPEPVIDFPQPWGQIALIRREPLLLVRYEPIGGPDAASTEVGVFLSANDPEVENALTKAEPPAHDDWIHKIVPKDHPQDHRKTFAKRTVEEIRAGKKRLLATFRAGDPGSQGGGEQSVSRRISEGLLGGLGGGPAPSPRGEGSSSQSKKPRVVLSVVRSDQDETYTVHELDVALLGAADDVAIRLTAGGAGYDNAGRMPVDGRVSFEWADGTGFLGSGPTIAITPPISSALSLVVKVASDLRFRPKVSVEVQGGA
jgi:hypothetical protein